MFIFPVYKKTYSGVMYSSAFGGTLIGIIMLVYVNHKASVNPFIVVISCRDHEAENKVKAYLNDHVEKASIKSKTAQSGAIELNYEIRLKGDDTDFITSLSEMEGVNSAVLVSYNGDYLG